MEPVMVVGDGHISSAAEAIQYPPDAATDPMDTITGLPLMRVSSISRRINSEANVLPPPVSIRKTNDLILSFSRA